VPKTVRFSHGPFLGMRYTTDPTRWDPKYVYRALNMVPADAENGGPYIRYPSFVVTDTAIAAAPQGIFWFAAFGQALAVIGGNLYQVGNWGAPFVSNATIVASGAALNAAGRVWATEFNKQLVLHDGVNRPFMVSLAGVVTSLTNAPASVYGNPTVYYGKLFFIKGADRYTLVWSEENAANTGYEAGGFNNAWTLQQSGNDALEAIQGMNDALYFWRRSSIGAIHGAVTPDFSAAGTHDEVSRKIGSVSASPLAVGDHIWFSDQFARPCRLAQGKLELLDKDIPEFFTDNTAVNGAPYGLPGASRGDSECRVGYEPRFNMVIFVMLDVLSRVRIVCFSAASGAALCELDPDPTLGVAWGIGAWSFAYRGTATGFGNKVCAIARAAAGNVFFYDGSEAGGPYYAASGAAHQPNAWRITLPPRGDSPDVIYQVSDLEAELDLQGGAAGGAVTFGLNADQQVGVTTAVGAAIVVGAQANRRTYVVRARAKRRLRFAQGQLDGNASLGYWGVHRVHIAGVPMGRSAKVT